MGLAKQIVLKPINSKIANEFVKKVHYSGSVVQNSTLHLGAFLDGELHGVMQYGNPIDKRNSFKMFNYPEKEYNKRWNQFLELNRMAFDDKLPKNSESRCIAISFKLIKKHYPHIKWIVSYADGTQCGDGTIYRASGFKLIGVKKNSSIYEIPNVGIKAKTAYTKGKNTFCRHGTASLPKGSKVLEGFQIRYIHFIDKEEEKNLAVPIVPFSEIDKMGAGMYKGKKITMKERKELTKE